MRKPKLHPLDIWEAYGWFHSKGHHDANLFCASLDKHWGLLAFPHRINTAYARVLPPVKGEERTLDFCKPGPGAFPITYWEG